MQHTNVTLTLTLEMKSILKCEKIETKLVNLVKIANLVSLVKLVVPSSYPVCMCRNENCDTAVANQSVKGKSSLLHLDLYWFMDKVRSSCRS